MSGSVFHRQGEALAAREIVELTGALVTADLSDRWISDVAAVDRAGPHDVTFVDRAAVARQLQLTQAGFCFVRAEMVEHVGPQTIALVVEDPYPAFVRVAAVIYPDAVRPSSLFELQGNAPSALLHPAARVETGVTIDPMAMVGPGAEIGSGTVIGPMAVIGPRVRIGRDCVIGAGASLTNALVGDRVSLDPGCRIGPAGQRRAQPASDATPALGRAILQDKVVIGSNSIVERGGDRDTVVGEGTVVEPLVRIPADVVLGRYCRIVAADEPKPGIGFDIDAATADGVQLAAGQLSCTGGSHSQR
jgi:UDP-3-O-[3-hydroxymyristoyl] glucosamine N-acyltransferase